MKYYNLTFKTKDLETVYCYLSKKSVLYAVLHYDETINYHIHVISSEWCFGYDEVFIYCKLMQHPIDVYKFYKYLTNGHCKSEILFSDNIFTRDIESVSSNKKLDLEDLILELCENVKLQIVKPHSYYLSRYGSVYLNNFKKIRDMFDMSSNFYEF